jgi:UDP-glucose 4-epimerase
MWKDVKVLVTGGASFIGSHLVEKLVELEANVRVADNLSSGKLENLSSVSGQIDVKVGDLKDLHFAAEACAGCEVVFHLAADHGGRGYIGTHPANCVTNMALDNIVFEQAHKQGVDRITFASSACTYPTDIQEGKTLLREDMISFATRGGAFSDEEYGWAKLMGEMSLKAYCKQHGMKTSSVRIFTAYGPRENESHAIIALIARAFIQQDPYQIWGDGTQSRNFTYVDDIVRGLILASENIEDGTAVNAGIPDFISLNQAAETVFKILAWTPSEIEYLTGKPVGVLHRAADTDFAAIRTGWAPQWSFEDGLRQTVDWYKEEHQIDALKNKLNTLLMSR